MTTIKAKLILSTVVAITVIIILSVSNYIGMRTAAHDQDTGARKAADVTETGHGIRIGFALSAKMSDAIINRDLEAFSKGWPEFKSKRMARFDAISKLANTTEEKELVAAARKTAVTMISTFDEKMMPLLKGNSEITPEIQAVNKELGQYAKIITSNMEKVAESMIKEAKLADESFDLAIKRTITIGIVISLIGIIFSIVIAIFITRAILKPLNRLLNMLTDVAQGEGDLTKRLDASSGDEIAQASSMFNQFIEKLHGIISKISSTSNQVALASNQLNSTAEHIATGAEEVAAQTGTVATAGEEMSATSGDIAQNCQMAAEGAQRASQTASDGAEVVRRTIDGIKFRGAKTRENAVIIESLGARSDQIGAIVATIEDIADQTNLLALNAAIEAARAGEQGRGFAVVADEVRNLATRTTNATKEIGGMIRAIQNETKQAIVSMEEGVKGTEKGAADAAQLETSLNDILQQINDVAMQVNQIATAAEEQTATTSEISNNMMQITEVVQQTSQGAHESAKAAAQLNGNAEELQRLVRQFKL
jgi:methyl-accepting chemotaxis protein